MSAHDTAFRVETRGIDVVTDGERHGSPKGLFWVWFSGQLTISAIIIGQLFTTLGLSLGEAVIVSAFTALSFVVVGLASLPGPHAGTATLTISRASFGIKGNILPAFFSWLNLVGWESVTIVITVNAMLSLAKVLGFPASGTAPTLFALVFALILTFSIPILGHATVVIMQRFLAYGIGALAIVMVFLVVPHVHWMHTPIVSHLAAQGVVPTMVLAASIGLMSTSLSWTNYAADYTRYLSKTTSGKSIVVYTALGGGLASFLFLSVGALLGTFIRPAAYGANPVAATMHILPNWYAIPFLLVVIVGQIANNYLNAYSSSMSFLALGVKLKRYYSVMIDAGLSTLISLYALFLAPGFLSFFENFLSLSILVIGPWTAIYLVNHWMVKGHYDGTGFFNDQSSPYWFKNGVNWSAVGSLIIGGFAAFWTVNSALWVSPLSSHYLLGMDLSAFVGPIVAGFVYALWTRPFAQNISVAPAMANRVKVEE